MTIVEARPSGGVSLSPAPNGRLIGRDDELSVVRLAAERARSGRAKGVAVLGAAGVGKTSFVRYVSDSLDAARTFRITCRAGSDSGFRRLCGNFAIGASVPVDAAAREAHGVLVAEARNDFTVVSVDDLHWADAGTLTLVEHLLDTIDASGGGERLLLLIAAREVASASRTNRLVDDPAFVRVALAPFDELTVADFVELETGLRPDPTFARELVDRTGGNPLRLRVWLESHGEGTITTGVYAARTRELLPQAHRVVTGIAIYGEPVPASLLRLLGGGDELSETTINELRGLVSEGPEGWWFVHPEIHREVYESTPVAERSRWHGWIAQHLLDTVVPSSQRSVRVERHLRHSRTADPTVRLALSLEAGAAALALGTWDYAADAYNFAASRLDATDMPSSAKIAHHLAIGQAFSLDSRPGEALDQFWRAHVLAEDSGDREDDGEALVRAVRCRLSGELDSRAWPEVAPLRRWIVDNPLSPRVVEALVTLADVEYAAERFDEGARCCERAQQAAGPEERPSRPHALVAYASGLQKMGRLEVAAAADCFDRAGEFATGLNDDVLDSWWRVRLAVAAHAAGEGRSTDAIAGAVRHCTTTGRWGDAALVSGIAAAAAAAVGATEIGHHGRNGLRYLRRSGYPAAAHVLIPAIVHDQAVRGRRAETDSLIADMESRGIRLSWWLRPMSALTCGDNDRAAAYLASRTSPRVSRSLGVNTVGAAAASAVLAAAGLLPPSAETARDLQTAAQRGLVWLLGWPMTVARAAGLALAALGEPQAADAWFAMALEEAARVGARLEHAVTLLDRAEYGLAHDPARDVLNVLRTASELGAVSVESRARRVLSLRPSSPPNPANDIDRTFLYTDIVSSTALNVAVGNDVFVSLLRDHNAVVRTRSIEQGGVVFHNTGDGYGVWFGSARAAWQAARAIHRDLANRPRLGTDGTALTVRIGIAQGRAVVLENDLFGVDVVRTVRICSHANQNETALDESAWTQLTSPDQARFQPVYSVALKGIPRPETLYVTSPDSATSQY
jgi:class 3 adenylate cyclase/tetratricopeptide (TPR) repeat protein